MAAARPLVQVYGGNGEVVGQVASPAVLNTPIRYDIVQYVQSNLRKNSRVPYSVAKWAGTQTSAVSWGTGRAVARIPRVPGGGTHRAGQGAFGNMCRGGRMFAPTRTWRRWHRKVNVNQKRYAVASAIAASSVPALVLARGHRVSGIPELPLVVATDAVETLTKTKLALALLTKLKANEDVERTKVTKKTSGKARLRNRSKKIKAGPLIVVGNKGTTAQRAFRNLAGVQVANVNSLNLLLLAPGGHLGRFIIWTQSAFDQLNTVFGTADKASTVKKGYFLPRPIMANPDVRRVIQSDSVQALVSAKPERFVRCKKQNYLKHAKALYKLNPYAAVEHGNAKALYKQAVAAKKSGSSLRKTILKKANTKGSLKGAKRSYAKYNKLVKPSSSA
jgi:large subunit ribosomal protein L4e